MAPPGGLSDRGRECGLKRGWWTRAAGSPLDHACEAKRSGLVERSGDDLHAAREAGRSNAGRYGDGGQSCKVEGRRCPHQRLDHGLRLAVEVVVELVATLRRGRNRRGEKRIEPLC